MLAGCAAWSSLAFLHELDAPLLDLAFLQELDAPLLGLSCISICS